MIYCFILDLSSSHNNHEELQKHKHIGHNEIKLITDTITLTKNVSSRLFQDCWLILLFTDITTQVIKHVNVKH